MKKSLRIRFFAVLLCLAMVLSLMPALVFAEPADDPETVNMIAGDVIVGFAPAGAKSTSEDPSIAWIDDNGNLNALKAGETNIQVEADADNTSAYHVVVGDFSDGSETVGRLKILARFNDSMQFYDGHVYLLFTSYQDGVEISVPDLYGGYEISDQYYKDINENINNGSNHTGSDTDKYFTFRDDMTGMTLNRGEIVTIGMYRGFELSVMQAALGMIQNSSVWNKLVKTGKTKVVENLFQYLRGGRLTLEEGMNELVAIIKESGGDPTTWLDGVVTGGVCFNRELYNQKLEWDQFENVTYELDITKNQLNAMMAALQYNLNKFNIMSNSCATVALRAWNAAVGTRGETRTAYYLDAKSDGIYAFMDAPKGVRDNIKNRLPGYYLNNAEGVAEPDAGYQDDTGWVYVSAPEKVNAWTPEYTGTAICIDETKSDLSGLVSTAKAGTGAFYNPASQQIEITVSQAEAAGGAFTISGIDFKINETTVSLNAERQPEGGVWFRIAANPAEGQSCYVTDADGKAVQSEYADGILSFYAPSFPFTYKVVGDNSAAKHVLKTRVLNGDKASVTVSVYCKEGETQVPLGESAEVAAGTKIYVKAAVNAEEETYLLNDITLNGASILAEYDPEEEAYVAVMPNKYATLTIDFEEGDIGRTIYLDLQVSAGDVLDITDYVKLSVGASWTASDRMKWKIEEQCDLSGNPAGDIFSFVDETCRQVRANKPGYGLIRAAAEGNENISAYYLINVYENTADMVKVTFNNKTESNASIVDAGKGEEIPFSGFLVAKGTELKVSRRAGRDPGKVISEFTANGVSVAPGATVTVNEDTQIDVKLRDAEIAGVPDTVRLAAKGDTCQLNAKVQYKGLLGKWGQVYDPSLRFESPDPLVEVDETGKITVAGDVPEEGAAVILTVYNGEDAKGLSKTCKVIVGDYAGGDIVGKLTISARPTNKMEPVAHGQVTFTAYENVDLNISYYEYYKPNEKYYNLMWDYEDHPENYPSDPALYTEAIPLENRASYFDVYTKGAKSEAQPVSIQRGESLTFSHFSTAASHMDLLLQTLENGSLGSSRSVQEFIEQAKLYAQGQEIDGEKAFDSLVGTIAEMFFLSRIFGVNPADGIAPGGLFVNTELYKPFKAIDSQMPNNYYSVEITRDELALLKAYLANPENNYYSMFNKNCASGVRDIWNATLAGRTGLQLKSNYTGMVDEPESLYFELGLLKLKKGIDGEGGTDFYPRSVPARDPVLTASAGNFTSLDAAIGSLPLDPSQLSESSVKSLIELLSSLQGKLPKVDQTKVDAITQAVKSAISSLELKNIPVIPVVKLSWTETEYSGKQQKPDVTVSVLGEELKDSDYTVEYDGDCTNAGDYKATVTLKGTFSGTANAAFKITKKAAVPKVTLSKNSYTYNGKVRTPKVTVSLNGKKLDASGYDVVYDPGRTKVGSYNVKVTLKGNYTGTGSSSFTILPKNTVLTSVKGASKAVSVKWKKQTAQTTGYEIRVSTNKNFKSGVKTVTVKKNTKTSAKIKGLKANKTYYVSIRTYKTVNGKKYYSSSWSKAKKVKTKK